LARPFPGSKPGDLGFTDHDEEHDDLGPSHSLGPINSATPWRSFTNGGQGCSNAITERGQLTFGHDRDTDTFTYRLRFREC